MISRIPKLSITARLIALFVISLAGVDIAFAAPPAAPSNLRFTASTASDLATIAWDDNSNDEVEFLVEIDLNNGQGPFEAGFRPSANSTSVTFSGFSPNSPVDFRIRASNLDGESAFSNVAIVETKDNYQIVASCITLTPGDDFSRLIETNFSGIVSLSTSLPGWMNWDNASETLSGSGAVAGITKLTFSASSGPHSRTRDFYVQVINEAPLAQNLPGNLFYKIPSGGPGPSSIDLTTHFFDPDMGRAAAMNTPFGPINIGFYDDAIDGAPLTVANFFAYAEAGRWDGTFFHRSVRDFVIQGGGYVPDGVFERSFLRVPSFAPVVNEFNGVTRSNICGTIAMAKQGGNPNSATSEWFFSVDDNALILDPQNGGFTVFGRAADMDVVDQISAFDTATHNVFIDGFSSTLSDWPLSATSANSPLVSELASMSSVVEIPTLSFEVTGGGAVVTAAIVGTELQLTPLSAGEVDLEIVATDLNGATVSETMTVTVYLDNTYGAWALDGGLTGTDSAPEENFGGGILANLQRYGFGGDPDSSADDVAVSPTLVRVQDEGETYDAIRFYHRKSAVDLTYTVQRSSDLDQWSNLWTTADGNADELVTTVEDMGDFWRLTVRAPEKVGMGSPRQFFQVLVALPES